MKTEVGAIRALNSFLDAAPEITRQAASIAINSTLSRKGMSRYTKAIKSQVAFPGGYLDEADKFGITQFAKPGDLTAAITARQRPTSLARFANGAVGGEGATVKVQPGRTLRLKKAFMVRLMAGTQLTGETYNLGLAIRIPGGPSAIRGKKDTSRMVRLSKDVFLLYGPSVDQVFRSVSVTETPAVLNEMETEFYRQFARLS